MSTDDEHGLSIEERLEALRAHLRAKKDSTLDRTLSDIQSKAKVFHELD